MENQEEENNKSKQDQNPIGIKSNESVQINQSNKSVEKDKEKENLPNNEENKTNEQNNSKKSLTAKENQNQDNKDKETVGLNLLYQGNNSNNDNEDITNIKYVSQNQIEKLKQEQNKKNQNELNPQSCIITLKDLQQNPNKKLLINSTRSLRALYDSGITLDQLYHKTMDEFIQEHKEVLHLDEETRLNRYHFYEKLRMDKINNLVEYREKLIQDEIEEMKMNEAINNMNNNTNGDYSEQIKPMKNIILDNDKRIAREEIDIMQKQYEKELANIIQLELDKDLFNLEMKKQQEKYAKEYKKLNFLNFNSGEIKDEDEEEKRKSLALIQKMESNKNNYKSLSLPKKPKIFVDPENTYLDNLHSLQQTLINQKYEKKQKKVAQKLERLEKVRKITAEQRTLKKRIGEERAAQNLQKNAVDFWKKHDELVKEIQDKKIIIFQNKKKFENMTKNRNEWNNLKYIIKMDLIADMKRKDENERMVRYIELMERQSRIERIKNDRSNVVDNKLFQKDYLNSERKKNIVKINDILVNGISEENLDKILNQFPQNKELFKVIQNYKKNKKKLMDSNYNTFKTEKSASIKRPKSHGKLFLENIKSNKRKESGKIEQKEFPNLKIPNLLYTKENNKALTETNKISNESDIKDKIKLYKELLSKQFFQKVQKEKENEEMRLKELEKIEDKNKRYQLEKKFRKERALVFMRLERENQKINEKINMYEFNLKNIDKIDNNNNKI